MTVASSPHALRAFGEGNGSSRNSGQFTDEFGKALRAGSYYYATLFRLRNPGEHSPALTPALGQGKRKVEIIAYELLAP